MDFVRAKQCLGIKTSACMEELTFEDVKQKFVVKVMRDSQKHDTRWGQVVCMFFIPLWSQNIRQTSARGVSVFGFKEEEGVGEDDGGQLEPVQEEVGGGGASQHGPCQGGEAEKKKLKYIVFILGRLGRMRKQILTMVWRKLISQSH